MRRHRNQPCDMVPVVVGFDGSRSDDSLVVAARSRPGQLWVLPEVVPQFSHADVSRYVEMYTDFTLMPWQRWLLEAMYPGTAIADQDPDVWGDQA